MSPSSLLATTPTALILSGGITAIPVLIRLFTSPVLFDLPSIPVTLLLGIVAFHFSRPSQITAPQIHQITFPIATMLSAITIHITSKFQITLLVPTILMYYGIFTIPASTPSITLWSKLRYHPLLRKILHKDDSRKIFTFLCLNLGFMCIQMGYGVYTNSLGLVSDSIHMLVDCAAIAFGLAASVLADEAPETSAKTELEGHSCHDHDHDHKHFHTHSHDHNHNHGHDHDHEHAHSHDHSHCHSHSHTPKPAGKWSKLEDLAGFANGVFLVFVCLGILAEALVRLTWPEEVVEVEQLLVVSILGLAVNLVGVFSFNHGFPWPP